MGCGKGMRYSIKHGRCVAKKRKVKSGCPKNARSKYGNVKTGRCPGTSFWFK